LSNIGNDKSVLFVNHCTRLLGPGFTLKNSSISSCKVAENNAAALHVSVYIPLQAAAFVVDGLVGGDIDWKCFCFMCWQNMGCLGHNLILTPQ